MMLSVLQTYSVVLYDDRTGEDVKANGHGLSHENWPPVGKLNGDRINKPALV
jgi:hypothetical protein